MTTNRRPRIRLARVRPARFLQILILVVGGFVLAQHSGYLPLALLLVAVIELQGLVLGSRPLRKASMTYSWVLALIMGFSVVIVIALLPKLATQLGVAVLYGAWRLWWLRVKPESSAALLGLLVVQAMSFEALFLMAAVWRTPDWITLVLVWLTSYIGTYVFLAQRGERGAGVLAATWALVVAEASWVFLTWLVSYVGWHGYIIVPQPALVLTALAYCFGSIYISQREGKLSRSRLTEYLLIGFILIAIVAMGTPWRGTM